MMLKIITEKEKELKIKLDKAPVSRETDHNPTGQLN